MLMIVLGAPTPNSKKKNSDVMLSLSLNVGIVKGVLVQVIFVVVRSTEQMLRV